MEFWSSISNYFSKTGSEENVFILPPGRGSPSGIDASDLKQIHDEINEEMSEEGTVDIEEYAREFQTRGQDRNDYRALSRDILLDMGKDFDFVAEYTLLFEEKLDEKIEYMNSDGYNTWRIYRYNFVKIPEDDMRTSLEAKGRSIKSTQTESI